MKIKWAYALIRHCDRHSQTHTDSFTHKLSTACTHTGCLLPWCPSMTKRDKQVCSEHILVSLCPPLRPVLSSPFPFHHSDKGSSVILHVHSSYPSVNCHNLPLLSDRLLFMCWCIGLWLWQSDRLDHYVLLWLWVLFFPSYVSVYLMQVCAVLHKKHFSYFQEELGRGATALKLSF